jgi:hypothetical protein
MSKEIEKMPERELYLHELDDWTQLNILLEGALIHSDFTIQGVDSYRIYRILKHIEETNGCVGEEDFKKTFKSKKQLEAYMQRYSLSWLLQSFAASVLRGDIELTGGQCITSNSAVTANHDSPVDILGLFIELTERFKFKKSMIYQALADQLKVAGHDKTREDRNKNNDSSNAYSTGAEYIRQTIIKLKKQLPKE